MASFVIGPLATFERPLIDEELPTLRTLADWSIDMDLDPARGVVQPVTFALRRPDMLTAPSLARRYRPIVRRTCG